MGNKSRFDSRLLLDNREIRVFLSSTFSDMKEERSALVRTFNTLKVAAMQRNVTLSLLDLRWGVTDEEARTGKVVSVCLNEIERSHPFFIGVLGSHYGTAFDPEELRKNPDLLERYPWIEQDAGRSITEIEMLYGVLRNTDNPVDAAFYIKQTEEPDDNPRQTDLKKTIRAQKRFPVEDYSSIDELCTFVEKEVYGMLDRHFPDGEHTPLERERTAQRAFVNSRHNNFVGREDDLRFLDRFACSERRRLVITGDSGMGKSALLANWIRNNETNATFNLAYHFVGNSLSGNSYESVLRHLCDEIYDLYGIEKDPNRKEKPEEEAQRLVDEVGHREKPLVAVIDGINQILSPTNEKLLLWLPSTNGKVQFIFTTLADDITMHSLECRGYEHHTLGPLSDAQREEFAVGYLDRVGKHLEPRQLCRIVDDPENRNTLVLRTLLDELICFGSYEHLDERIDRYLDAEGLPDFFDRVLQRMEEDYDNGQQLVSQTLTLIALSEHGLSVDEIIAITGFRPMDWHLFYCAFFNHLVVKEGLVTFSHQYVADAVARRYSTANAAAAKSYRRKIVNHFVKADNDDKALRQRRISELAHQYYHLSDWDSLHEMLLSVEALDYYLDLKPLLLANYWRALINHDSDRYKLDDYKQLLQDETRSSSLLYNNLGYFILLYFDYSDLALLFYNSAANILLGKFGNAHPYYAQVYENIGGIYYQQSEYDKALENYFTSLNIYETLFGKEHAYTYNSYQNIGVVYFAKGCYEKALQYLNKALEIREKSSSMDSPVIAETYCSIGVIYEDKEEFDVALAYYNKALNLCNKHLGPNHPRTALTLINFGDIYKKKTNYNSALEYYNKALMLLKETLGEEHSETADAYVNIGQFYGEIHKNDKALEYYNMALPIFERVYGKRHPRTALLYSNIGVNYKEQKNYEKAIEYYNKAIEIQKNKLTTKHCDLAMSYNNLAVAYKEVGKLDEALDYHFMSLDIYKNNYGLSNTKVATSLNNIGAVYVEKEDFETALQYFNQALKILNSQPSPNFKLIAFTYDNIGSANSNKTSYLEALDNYISANTLFEKIFEKDNPVLLNSYGNIVDVCVKLNEFDRAVEYCLKALSALEGKDDSYAIEKVRFNEHLGFVYYCQKVYQESIKYYLMALDYCKVAFGAEHPNTAQLCSTIASVYYLLNDLDNALNFFEQALPIMKKYSDPFNPQICKLYNNMATVYCDKGIFDKALEYYLLDLAIREKVYDKNDPYTEELCRIIAVLYYQMEQYPKALKYFEKSLNLLKSELEDEHPDVQAVQELIDATKAAMGDQDNGKKSRSLWKRLFGK